MVTVLVVHANTPAFCRDWSVATVGQWEPSSAHAAVSHASQGRKTPGSGVRAPRATFRPLGQCLTPAHLQTYFIFRVSALNFMEYQPLRNGTECRLLKWADIQTFMVWKQHKAPIFAEIISWQAAVIRTEWVTVSVTPLNYIQRRNPCHTAISVSREIQKLSSAFRTQLSWKLTGAEK